MELYDGKEVFSMFSSVEAERDDVHEGSGRGMEEEGQREGGPHEEKGKIGDYHYFLKLLDRWYLSTKGVAS